MFKLPEFSKYQLIIALLIFFTSNPLLSANKSTSSYQKWTIESIKPLVENFDKKNSAKSHDKDYDYSNSQFLIGFISAFLLENPDQKNIINSYESSKFTKGVFCISLYKANLRSDADKFCTDNMLESVSDIYRETDIIQNTKLDNISSTNDLLIGAFYATSNIIYMNNAFEILTKSHKDSQRDSLRIAMVMDKFGPNLSDKRSSSNLPQAIKQKYQNNQELQQVMTMATAYWSWNSLSKKNQNLAQKLQDYFDANQQLKTILLEEKTYFSNYLMALIVRSTNKDSMSDFIRLYENLGIPQ